MRATEEHTRKRTERQRGVRTPKDIVLLLLANILSGSVMKVKNVMAIVELELVVPCGDAQRAGCYNGGSSHYKKRDSSSTLRMGGEISPLIETMKTVRTLALASLLI